MLSEKEKFYEVATQKLIQKVDEFNLGKLDSIKAKNLVVLFRDSFKLPSVKHSVFYPYLGEKMNAFAYDSDGFCKTSYLYKHLMKNCNFELHYIDNIWTYGPHHYLFHKPTKQVFDLTFDQYTNIGIEIPYNIGTKVIENAKNYEVASLFADAIGIKVER